MPAALDSRASLAAVAVVFAVLAATRPRWALTLLLAALPFFTHQLLHPAAFWLLVVVAALEAGYAVGLVSHWRTTWRAARGNPLLLLGALLAAAAFLSLSSLPLGAIWKQHAAALRLLPPVAWPHYARDWLMLPEAAREFSITTSLLALQAFLLGVIVWRETRLSPATSLTLARAITCGLVAFVGLGLLEGFDVVRLDALRGQVGVGLRVGAVQSTAGNPGWFAQYVVYALPYTLVLLHPPSRTAWRVALLTLVAASTTIALVLGFQRGGWLSGALVLIYLALAASRVAGPGDARPRALRPLVTKAVALLGLAVALAMGGAGAWVARSDAEGNHLSARQYIERFKSIRNADRLPYASASLRIAALHPWLGGGNESFAYRYQMYFEDPGGLYAQSGIEVPLATSAHNVFLQTLSGSGLAGFLALAAMFVTSAWMARRTWRRPIADDDAARARRFAVCMACGSLLGMAAYGMVQEVFYVHALRLFFFVAIGIVAGASGEVAWPPRVARALWAALAVVLACHLAYEYVWPGPGRLLRSAAPTGLFAEELDPGRRPFHWTTEEATWPVPPRASHWQVDVRSLAPFAQRVEIAACTRATGAAVTLEDHAWQTLGGRLAGCGPGARLTLRVTPAWRPSRDDRLLGTMVAALEFR